MSRAEEIVSVLENTFRNRDLSGNSVLTLDKDGSYIFEYRNSDLKVQAEIFHQDVVGLLIKSLSIEKDTSGDPDLRRMATELETRVNYLLEPLKIIELDESMNAVQLRSENPELKDGKISYFEAILKTRAWFGQKNILTLTRYLERGEKEERRPIYFPLTKQQLQKFLNDALATL